MQHTASTNGCSLSTVLVGPAPNGSFFVNELIANSTKQQYGKEIAHLHLFFWTLATTMTISLGLFIGGELGSPSRVGLTQPILGNPSFGHRLLHEASLEPSAQPMLAC